MPVKIPQKTMGTLRICQKFVLPAHKNSRFTHKCFSFVFRYNLGLCQLRWPFILALILVVDQMTLSMLGFALTFKRPPKVQELHHITGSVFSLKPNLSSSGIIKFLLNRFMFVSFYSLSKLVCIHFYSVIGVELKGRRSRQT